MRLGSVIRMFLIGFIFLTAIGCQKKREQDSPIRLISFKGNLLMSYTKPTAIVFGAKSDFTAMPVQDEDLLIASEDFLIFASDLPDTVEISSPDLGDSLLYFNGKLTSILIRDSVSLISFFNNLRDDEIKNLRYLQLDTSPDEFHKSQLEKIALVNPHVNLVVLSGADSNTDLEWLLGLFRPRKLIMDLSANSILFSSPEKFDSLETLAIGCDPTVRGNELPEIKSLKNLLIFSGSQLDSTIVTKNKQLEAFSIIDYEGEGWCSPYWQSLKNLRQLTIFTDSLPQYDFATYHPNLQTLAIDDASNISGIAKLKKLKWLTIQDSIGQQGVNQISNSMPSLELLELSSGDTLLRYDSLVKLPNLKYLILAENPEADSTLYALKHLTYLSVNQELFEDSIRIVALKRNLPHTTIVPNDGFCMGSGWLLVVFPLTLLFVFIIRKQQ